MKRQTHLATVPISKGLMRLFRECYEVMIYLEDSIEVSCYFARSWVGQEPGLRLQALSLFCWKFSFSWKYIDLSGGKGENQPH